MARQRGSSWLGDAFYGTTPGGKPRRHRIAFKTKAEAEAFERDPSLHFAPKLTVQEAFRQGYQHLWSTGKNQKDRMGVVEELIAWFGPHRSVAEAITPAKCYELVASWRQPKVMGHRRDGSPIILPRLSDKRIVVAP